MHLQYLDKDSYKQHQMSKEINLQSADNIRALAVAMVEKAKSGHPGGPMGWCGFYAHSLF